MCLSDENPTEFVLMVNFPCRWYSLVISYPLVPNVSISFGAPVSLVASCGDWHSELVLRVLMIPKDRKGGLVNSEKVSDPSFINDILIYS